MIQFYETRSLFPALHPQVWRSERPDQAGRLDISHENISFQEKSVKGMHKEDTLEVDELYPPGRAKRSACLREWRRNRSSQNLHSGLQDHSVLHKLPRNLEVALPSPQVVEHCLGLSERISRVVELLKLFLQLTSMFTDSKVSESRGEIEARDSDDA